MLKPVIYHELVRNHFKKQTKTWNFFAQAKNRDEQVEQFKSELLKNTYKFLPDVEKHIYEKIEITKDKLNLSSLVVTAYQAQYSDETNASIVFLNNEAHIVFSGRILQLLDEEELLAVIAHELTHVKLYLFENGELEVADRIITAIANHPSSEPAYYETARLFRLYTEIFCDRGALFVVEKTDPVITSLVKTATGLEKVSAESYRKQAEEIFNEVQNGRINKHSHPENFVRTRAIELWKDKSENANEEIMKIIEGKPSLDELDIFQQNNLTEFTRLFIQLFLKPNWFRTVLTLNHAREFLNDFNSSDTVFLDEKMIDQINSFHGSIHEYLCWLMLDFARIDHELDLVPMGWAFQFSEDTGLQKTFEKIIMKEMKLSEKKIQVYRDKALSSYYEVKEGENEQIYQG